LIFFCQRYPPLLIKGQHYTKVIETFSHLSFILFYPSKFLHGWHSCAPSKAFLL
jgi:hypothetical protein